MKRVVFLAASVPDPRRDRVYYDTADITAIREAVRAVCAVVLARGVLVFGGHPAITPLVRQVAESLDALPSVRIYQSAYFAAEFPADNIVFPWQRVVAASGASLEHSIARMRDVMFADHAFYAGVFIGGMDGVEAEYQTFARLHPKALRLPVGSTGAAADRLLSTGATHLAAGDHARLARDTAYGAMFEHLLWPRKTRNKVKPRSP